MDRRKKKAVIMSASIALSYSVLSYFMMFYYSGVFTAIFCFPYTIAFLVGFGLGSAFGYLSISLTFILIWYLLFVITTRIIK